MKVLGPKLRCTNPIDSGNLVTDHNHSFAYLDRKVGPFFDAQGVRAVAALDANELALAERFQDIVFVIAHGRDEARVSEKLYPAFQFGTRGELLPGLREIAYLLQPATNANAWYLAMWLRTRCDFFEGRSPEEVLRAGLLGPVLDLAKEEFSARSRGETADGVEPGRSVT